MGIDPLASFSVIEQASSAKIANGENEHLTKIQEAQRREQIRAAAHCAFIWSTTLLCPSVDRTWTALIRARSLSTSVSTGLNPVPLRIGIARSVLWLRMEPRIQQKWG